MKTPFKMLLIAAAGATAGAAVDWFAPWVLGTLSLTSPIRRCMESCLSGVEQTALFFARLIDPSGRTLAPLDYSLGYRVFLLIYFAVVGALLALCGYVGTTVLLRSLGRGSGTEHGEERQSGCPGKRGDRF
jgi:cellulose synthase/poly-beta-1,6-N-acetylglucosamine synthase-like glycosyltransferase